MNENNVIFWQAFILFLWFETDFILLFAKFKLLSKFIDKDVYLSFAGKFVTFTPHITSYWRTQKQGKLYKLLSCDFCFNFWMTAVFCVISHDSSIFGFAKNYVLSFVIYLIFRILYGYQQPR